jgi:formylglycine-generating enzyme required for sulfatase activity
MVQLPEYYCIDSTEVTRSQYATWLATAPALPPSNDELCGWKSSYAPDTSCQAGPLVCQGADCGNHPQVCVDWCDASAYCAGVGKRLCGAIIGGPVPFGQYPNASVSQWDNACTSHDANQFPYAGAFDATACNNAQGTTTAVGSLPGCQASGAYAGVYDLSGNAYEWEDDCDDNGKLALCMIRGGTFTGGGATVATCGVANSFVRTTSSPYVGFRCCSP